MKVVNLMNYLIVAAHPDDEVLGAGGTIRRLTGEGNRVDLCILCGRAEARANRPSDDSLDESIKKCCQVLGISEIYMNYFPNIKFNTVPHIDLVKAVEQAIAASSPDVVITHHPADVNNDHLHTSLAAQAAARMFQRRTDIHPLSEFWFMDVPSSTEWCVNSSMNKFEPNLFIEVGKEGVNKKIEALEMYPGVMRDYPHPRSRESIEGYSAYRGSQSGCAYAEAFQVVFRRISF